MSRGLGRLQQKILVLLAGGLAIGLSPYAHQHFRIIRFIGREWRKIDKQHLQRAIKNLYKSKLVSTKENSDGTLTLILTVEGKKKALTYKLESMRVKKPKKWDKKWRLVLFDVPEKERQVRDVFRSHLKQLGFYEFQKSAFIHPYDCQDEIDYLIEFYNVRKYVRFMVAESVDNELHLKKIFSLI